MLSNASPSAGVANPSMVGDTADISDNMENQPGPQEDPIGLLSNEGLPGGFESSMTDTEQESRWCFPLFVFFVSLFFGIAISLGII